MKARYDRRFLRRLKNELRKEEKQLLQEVEDQLRISQQPTPAGSEAERVTDNRMSDASAAATAAATDANPRDSSRALVNKSGERSERTPVAPPKSGLPRGSDGEGGGVAAPERD